MSFRSYGPGRYLAGQEGFEPSTNRLTADRTTSVLLTLNAKSPCISARALNFWWLHLKASIDPVCDVYLFPHHLNEGINPSLESRLNKNRHFVKCNFLDKSYFIENIYYRVTLFNIWFAYSSCLIHSPTRLSKKSL